MPWLNPDWSMADARSRKLEVWELYVSDWGDLVGGTIGGDHAALAFPPINEPGLPGVFGIAIGPKSTVDRCWVAYSLEKTIPPTAPPAQPWNYARALSVGSPLMYPQAGQKSKVTQNSALIGGGSLAVFPTEAAAAITPPSVQSTLFNRAYIPALGGAPQTFGPGIGPEALWVPPLLHLVFYLTPPLVGPPSVRAPYVLAGEYTQQAASTLELMAQIPTFGRKKVIITVSATGAGGGTFATGTIAPLAQNPSLNPNEGPRTTSSLSGGGAADQLVLTTVGDYLNLYVAAKGLGDVTTWSILATD